MDLAFLILLSDTINLRIEQAFLEETVTVALRSEALTAVCPSCTQAASHVHRRYQRKPRDLPMSGRPVRLIIEVRRSFCTHPNCPRTTCAEQVPSLLRPHAQCTLRLQEALQQLGLAVGGEAGARLGKQ
jgi:transposase